MVFPENVDMLLRLMINYIKVWALLWINISTRRQYLTFLWVRFNSLLCKSIGEVGFNDRKNTFIKHHGSALSIISNHSDMTTFVFLYIKSLRPSQSSTVVSYLGSVCLYLSYFLISTRTSRHLSYYTNLKEAQTFYTCFGYFLPHLHLYALYSDNP